MSARPSHATVQYSRLLTQIHHGEAVTLKPMQFLRYLATRRFQEAGKHQANVGTLKILSTMLGFQEDYLDHRFIGGVGFSPTLVRKLSNFTNSDATFWGKKDFTAADIESITFDYTKDMTQIAEPNGGSHQAWRKRLLEIPPPPSAETPSSPNREGWLLNILDRGKGLFGARKMAGAQGPNPETPSPPHSSPRSPAARR